MIAIPYEVISGSDVTSSTAYFFPSSLEIRGTLDPEIRRRGIFEAILYGADLNITGTFDAAEFDKQLGRAYRVLWNEATVSVPVSDMRGIRESVVMQWNGERLPMEPGVDNIGTGAALATPVPVVPGSDIIRFATTIRCNGSQTISFLPVGKTTSVHLRSAWPSPSFNGAFLPDTRTISDSGFDAAWRVLHYNRDLPQSWSGNRSLNLSASAFGVSLIQAVDGYQRTERTAKYAVLFVGLTFVTLLLIEVLSKRRVHPVQYLLVGMALSIFYTLLLALMEHAGFGMAYLAAAAAITVLVTGYARAVLGSIALAMATGSLVAGLYGYLYVVLQQEDHALLMGSVGLFLVLAAVMYLTRSIDWYNMAIAQERRAA